MTTCWSPSAARRDNVRRYGAADGKLVASYGRAEGRTYGVFNPMDWGGLLAIAADGQGGFVTVENHPRRVAHFKGRDKLELVNQWFGGVPWGTLAQARSGRPDGGVLALQRQISRRGKIDYAKHAWTMTHLYDLPEYFSYGTHGHRDMFPAFTGCSYWEVRHVGGQTFLVNRGTLHGGEGVSSVRVDEEHNRLVPVARLGVLHPTLDRKEPPQWWQQALTREGYHMSSRGAHTSTSDSRGATPAAAGRSIRRQ